MFVFLPSYIFAHLSEEAKALWSPAVCPLFSTWIEESALVSSCLSSVFYLYRRNCSGLQLYVLCFSTWIGKIALVSSCLSSVSIPEYEKVLWSPAVCPLCSTWFLVSSCLSSVFTWIGESALVSSCLSSFLYLNRRKCSGLQLFGLWVLPGFWSPAVWSLFSTWIGESALVSSCLASKSSLETVSLMPSLWKVAESFSRASDSSSIWSWKNKKILFV